MLEVDDPVCWVVAKQVFNKCIDECALALRVFLINVDMEDEEEPGLSCQIKIV